MGVFRKQGTGGVRRSLVFWAVAWALLLAVAAGVGLAVLVRWHRAAAHEVAQTSVAGKGSWLANRLTDEAAAAAEKAFAGSGENAARAWKDFSATLHVLRGLEEGLEYVEVRNADGVTLFAEGAREWGRPGRADDHPPYPIRVSRERVGESGVEVVAFDTFDENGAVPVRVSMGLRRNAVDREESDAMRALDSMYHIILWGGGIAFALAIALLAWVLRREEKREKARRREEHLAFSGVLANGIVHDFRNPMSSLRLDAQMLEREAAKGDGAASVGRMGELAGRMRHTLDRMERVFQEFLALARPDAAGTQSVTLDLAAVARECSDMLAPRAEAAGVAIQQDVPAELFGQGTESTTKRALMNVILNAIQHAGPDGQVWIGGGRANAMAYLDVWNTGDAIPPADRDKIFEMFYTTRPEGTGLGLFLARTALEKCGGKLRLVDGCPRNGFATGFRLELRASEKNRP